jgi:pteridine reductase
MIDDCHYNGRVSNPTTSTTTLRQTALITGAAKRIGAQIVKRLHAQGYDVAIHYRHSKVQAQELANSLNLLRPNSAACFGANLSTKQGCDELLQQFSDWRNNLQLLVNNASMFQRTPFGEITEKQWQEQIDGNLKAAFFVSQAALGILRATPKANIINICDARWERPMAGFSAYAGAKAGMVALTRCLSLELAPLIRVNAVGPGSLDWPENNTFTSSQINALESNIPMQRIGTGDDIADAILYLSNLESYVNGQIINVDGGSSAVSG